MILFYHMLQSILFLVNFYSSTEIYRFLFYNELMKCAEDLYPFHDPTQVKNSFSTLLEEGEKVKEAKGSAKGSPTVGGAGKKLKAKEIKVIKQSSWDDFGAIDDWDDLCKEDHHADDEIGKGGTVTPGIVEGGLMKAKTTEIKPPERFNSIPPLTDLPSKEIVGSITSVSSPFEFGGIVIFLRPLLPWF